MFRRGGSVPTRRGCSSTPAQPTPVTPSPSSPLLARPPTHPAPPLQPWVHYVPTGYNGIKEIESVVRWLRDHDDLARAIGRNGQRFAQEHLTAEGRYCYLKARTPPDGGRPMPADLGPALADAVSGPGSACSWCLAAPAFAPLAPQVLFEEYARLMRYTPSIADFPAAISYEDEVRLHVKPDHPYFPLMNTTRRR